MKLSTTALSKLLALMLCQPAISQISAGVGRSASYSISGGTVKMGGRPASSPSYRNIGFVGAVQTPEQDAGDPKEDDDDTGFRIVDPPPPGPPPSTPNSNPGGSGQEPGPGTDTNGSSGNSGSNPEDPQGPTDNTGSPNSPAPPEKPKVIGKFAHQRIALGGVLDVTVSATGTAPLAYQWYKGREMLPGKDSATLLLDPLQVSDTGIYWVEVRNSLGFAKSKKFNLQVVAPPQITSTPGGHTYKERETILLEVKASGTPPLKYQWYRNGQLIPRAKRPVLKLRASTEFAGNYTVKISNEAGSLTSAPTGVTVLARPVISTPPVSVTAVVGEDAVFTVAAHGRDAGGTTVTYQWYKGRKLLVGETGDSLLIESVQKADKGAYLVHVGNQEGSVKSRPAKLTILFPPDIVRQPRDIVVKPGKRAVISVRAGGTRPLAYQWYKDGQILEGATRNHIRFTPVDPLHAGVYHVVINNPVGNAESVPGQITLSGSAVQFAGGGDWKATFPEWGQIEGLEGQESATKSDLDRDGIPNLLEYAFLGNPYESDPYILPSAELHTDPLDGSLYLALSWRESKEAAGLGIRLQATVNLKDWEDVDVTRYPLSKLDKGSHTVTTVYIPVVSSPGRFFRIWVSE